MKQDYCRLLLRLVTLVLRSFGAAVRPRGSVYRHLLLLHNVAVFDRKTRRGVDLPLGAAHSEKQTLLVNFLNSIPIHTTTTKKKISARETGGSLRRRRLKVSAASARRKPARRVAGRRQAGRSLHSYDLRHFLRHLRPLRRFFLSLSLSASLRFS